MIDVKSAWTVKNLTIPLKHIKVTGSVGHYPYLQQLCFPAVERMKISILLGTNIQEVFIPLEVKKRETKWTDRDQAFYRLEYTWWLSQSTLLHSCVSQSRQRGGRYPKRRAWRILENLVLRYKQVWNETHVCGRPRSYERDHLYDGQYDMESTR